MKIKISPNDSKIYQRVHFYADYLGTSVYVFNGCLSESNNIFLYNLCHYLAPNIHSLLTYGPSPKVLFLKSCTNSTYINPCHTIHALYFFPYMVFEYRHNMQNKIASTAIPSLNSASWARTENINKFDKILTNIFSFFSFFYGRKGWGGGRVEQLRYIPTFHRILKLSSPWVFRLLSLVYKNQCGWLVPTSFSFSLLT